MFGEEFDKRAWVTITETQARHRLLTDGEGIPDGYEVRHGLNPLLNDANVTDASGLTNLQKYQRRQKAMKALPAILELILN